MNILTHIIYKVGVETLAYYLASQIRDPQTRPEILALLQSIELCTVSNLKTLSKRAAVEGDIWLSQKLAKHADDENRHGQIFAYALKQIDRQISDEQHSIFLTPLLQGYSQQHMQAEVIDWKMFMGSTHTLELEASKAFLRIAKLLPEDEPIIRNLKKSLFSIAKDEASHAAYLHEAMKRRMPATEVQKLVDEWRTREINVMLVMGWNWLRFKKSYLY